MDEFAEEISYDETRNYSKRVLTSFSPYSYLKDGTIPEMSNEIPSRCARAEGARRPARPRA